MKEKEFNAANGYLMFTVWFLLLAGAILSLVFLQGVIPVWVSVLVGVISFLGK